MFLLEHIVGGNYALPYQERTFKSPPVPLRPGQIANTNARSFSLDFPKGPLAVRYFAAEVVDETDTPIPLTDVCVTLFRLFKTWTG